jgi:hypothetical protein
MNAQRWFGVTLGGAISLSAAMGACGGSETDKLFAGGGVEQDGAAGVGGNGGHTAGSGGAETGGNGGAASGGAGNGGAASGGAGNGGAASGGAGNGGYAGASAPDAGWNNTIACAPPVGSSSTGLACSPEFWPGFQFKISVNSHLVGLGIQGSAKGSTGSVHATVYRLTGPNNAPVLDNPSAVVVRTLVTLPGGTPAIGAASVNASLTPGWYALVVGTGAYGATASEATVPSGGTSGCTSNPDSGFPFTIRMSDKNYSTQAASPHLFVAIE